MTTEVEVQEVVYKLEEGKWKKWVLLAVLIAGTFGQVTLWFYANNGFKGLGNPHAMEQAEIARELARGHGFSTKMIRPAAIALIEKGEGSFPVDHAPDIYHAPLWSAVLEPVVSFFRDSWEMTQKTRVYVCDKAVAFAAFVFFLLGVLVNYFLVKRLFDQRISLLVVGFTLLCERFWEFTMSGLPQMLLFFLFSCAAYTLLRAVEARCAADDIEVLTEEEEEPAESDVSPPPDAERPRKLSRIQWLTNPFPWLVFTAALFGLLALTHGLTLWIFVGVLAFCWAFFERGVRVAAIMAAVVLIMYAPWLYRNYRVCGGWSGIGGLGVYTSLSEIRGSESSIMRSMDVEAGGIGVTAFPAKAIKQAHAQLGSIYKYLGFVVVVPLFFVALLHIFRRREIAVYRWGLLLMWIGGFIGMTIFGLDDEPCPSNDLHLLFIPLFAAYGLAFVHFLWTRVEVSRIRLVDIGFVTLLFVVSARPFLGTFFGLAFGPPERPWHSTPYCPPVAGVVRGWVTEKEIVMTDSPSFLAWYGDRKTLWLPMKMDDYQKLNDSERLKRPIVGLYLTPVSGNSQFIANIVKGEYKDWALYVTRDPENLKKSPFPAERGLAVDLESVVYFDRDRWTNPEN